MRAVSAQIARVAPTDASVLITGESGSGKELVSRSIHQSGYRANGPFVAVNCGAIPEALIEAEMFGFEKGSFTGACRAHQGVFERASGGTLFLDEITEMSADLQTRLLRVLETQRFYRVGGSQEIAVDVRVIAASNRCPLASVRDGRLREDLLYRLAVFPIHVPPLRERGDDLRLLAEHFLGELNAAAGTGKRFDPAALRALARHRWPGNVRELRNSVERAFILADEVVAPSPLASPPAETMASDPTAPQSAPEFAMGSLRIAVGTRLHEVERSLIQATLQHFSGDKRQTAQALGCSVRTLYNKVNGYNVAASYADS